MRKFINKIFYPIKWIFIKTKELFNYFYFDNNLGKIFIVFIPSLLLILLGAFIVFDNFQTASKDTTYLTNYGFGILIGIASICFSWARNMNIEIEPLMINRVSVTGENSFHSAIIFLIASAIKYSLVNLNLYIPKQCFYVYNILHMLLYVIFLICFAIAYIKFEGVIRDLNYLLYERLNKKQKN